MVDSPVIVNELVKKDVMDNKYFTVTNTIRHI